ncbi:GreA/GreB family elongation factor [candidate division WOR-3 bacterium]|nr:GreA/GreB family elongation factor [candidate division WOR-3 bacterium]
MSTLKRTFRDHLRHKRFGELETAWLELVESEMAFDDLVAEAELADRWAPAETVRAMLSVWADMLRDRGRFGEQLAVLRRLVRFDRNDLRLARELAECLRRLHGDNPDFDRLLQKSGLGFGRPIDIALAWLERMLALLPGALVLDPERGPGEVVKLDLLLDRVVVEFGDGRVEFKTEAASQALVPARPEGFYWLLHRDRPRLERMVASAPAEVVRRYLRDVAIPRTPAELKTGLADAVPAASWSKFWEQARRGLARDPHVRQLPRPSRSFQWSDEPVAEVSSSSRPQAHTHDAAEPDRLARMPADELVAGFAGLTTWTGRRQYIESLAASGRDDTAAIESRLFLADCDRRTRNLLAERIESADPAEWRALLDRLVTDYRRYPDAFTWLFENRSRLEPGSAPGLLSRAIDLVESPAHREHRAPLRNLLDKQARDLLAAALERLDADSARNLLGRLSRMRELSEYRRDELKSDVYARFPELEESAADDGIQSTQAGLDRARADLRRMVSSELPKTADEIARARAHGDLSENYEYKAAKEKQARLMARINRLQADLAQARALNPDTVDTGHVSVGCRVRLKDDSGTLIDYTLLGPWDSDIEARVISYLAPLGRRLLGKKPGDYLELDGSSYQVVAVTNALAG